MSSKPERLNAILNKDGVVALKNTRNHSVEFKHKNTDSLIGFLWNKVKNKQITIFKSHQHRVIVSAFVVDGCAVFTMELHIKTEPNVYKVENLVSLTGGKIQKTDQARLPHSVLATLNLDWFKELRVMLRKFNEQSIYAS